MIKLPLEERSISQIFLEDTDTKYIVPIYQRNYAWGDIEIKALISDVYDAYKKSETKKAPYYIGTLVTYERGENMFEVIDGQQRLTTIYIVLKALASHFDAITIRSQLTYSARQSAANALANLGQKNSEKQLDEGIINGYKIAQDAIKGIDNKELFVNYLINEVHIIHYRVPKDVDLNHYFEVMNSRGEQLESHEIVKSYFNAYLTDDKERSALNRVWEACSEMNLYIQQTFPKEEVFGKHMDSFVISDLQTIIDLLKDNTKGGKKPILDFLKPTETAVAESIDTELNDKFQSIIDFPNFLLIVLKLTCIIEGDTEKSITLDDKELLREFGKVLAEKKKNNQEEKFTKTFAYNLLKAKYLLDNFVVHHAASDDERSENPWKLRYYYKENKKNKYTKLLIQEGSDRERKQAEMQHLLSMLEVTFTPKQRKNYLLYCLLYLFNRDNMPTSMNEAQKKMDDYLKFLRSLADKYFYDVYLYGNLNSSKQPQPNAFDEAILNGGKLNWTKKASDSNAHYKERFNKVYEKGSASIPLYVFNYMDYILWKKYADELKGEKAKEGSKKRKEFFEALGCEDFTLDSFKNFYFTRTRKSLEHFYPQAKAVDVNLENKPEVLTHTDINCFGNFAMIGAEANSSGSNWDPKAKLIHYLDPKSDPVSVASLKFRIMMQICQNNVKSRQGLEWNVEDIEKHQKQMLDIIFSKEWCIE